MYPDREKAILEWELAGRLHPGSWLKHSHHVAHAAEIIAKHCDMDSEKAFVCGLLHDIGRRKGKMGIRHIMEGYNYALSKGWDDVARICLTHSFPLKDVDTCLGKRDISQQQHDFIRNYLDSITYDEYDKLIILCDALGNAEGFCILEKRFVDTTRRHGIYPFLIDRWNMTYEYKEYFEKRMGKSVYHLLPGIEKCIYC